MSPFATKRPCSYPGCATLTQSARCDLHKKQEQREYDRRRGYLAVRGYSRAWHITSKAYLERNPLCAECMKHRRVVAATVTDRIVPHKGDPALFRDPGNWQALCRSCHSRKTALHDGRWA